MIGEHLSLMANCIALIGCGSEDRSQASSIDGLLMTFSQPQHDDTDCRVRRITPINQDQHPLYILRGDTLYRNSATGQGKDIPLQVQFRGIEGRQSQQTIALPEFNVACSQLVINVDVGECIDQNRKHMKCPPITLRGADAFAEITLQLR
jgi:hypothetical protein